MRFAELKVINKTGIHARPAATIVGVASKFDSEIIFIKDGVRANAKSIMNILLLAAEPGSHIRVEVDGSDEEKAMEDIRRLFTAQFKDDTHLRG